MRRRHYYRYDSDLPVSYTGNLCKTCTSGLVAEGDNGHEQLIHCVDMQILVPFSVKRCTGYRSKNDVTLNKMEDIAWILRTDQSMKTVGFCHPAEFKRLLREGIENE